MADRELLCEWQNRFNYDSNSGKLSWRNGPRKFRAAGNISDKGYLFIRLRKKSYYVHRIAYALYHNKMPENEIDHINRNRQDNRICNLQDVTKQENQHNRCVQWNNTSGTTGVYFNKQAQKWIASIYIDGKQTIVGRSICKLMASIVRHRAADLYGYNNKGNAK